MISLIVAKCDNTDISSTNRVIGDDNNHFFVEYNGCKYPLTMISKGVKGEIGLSNTSRRWLMVALGTQVKVEPINPVNIKPIDHIHVNISYFMKQPWIFDLDIALASLDFLEAFNGTIMSKAQPIPFIHKQVSFKLSVENIYSNLTEIEWGICTKQTTVLFTPNSDSPIFLQGHNKTIFNPSFDFSKMGVGGLDEEFNTMFRRVFASRVLPVDVVEKMGIKHVKGILMHGPPGTGKTLMARQIGKMLNSREPKIVNGPEILNKYVGESESNIRKLFEDAEKEEKDKGKHSQLHIIIFDEIDSICKSRGSSNIGDSIVNQLLSKIDGINSLNNVLIIGMTNRLELLDEALTRPGRLELKLEIGLPNEAGRKQIFDIHMDKLKNNKMLNTDINIDTLAALTINYTGAEIEGLVRAATSYAYNRCITHDTFTADKEKLKNVQVTHDDFRRALNEIQPSFGTSDENLTNYYANPIVEWNGYLEFMSDTKSMIDRFNESERLLSILLTGIPKDGKTTMAVNLARYTRFPFIKFVSPENMIGMVETGKINYINMAFQNAYKSRCSVIIIDDIDIIMEYNETGYKYSNLIVQTLKTLIKKTSKNDNKLLIIATMNRNNVVTEMIGNVFTDTVHVPCIRNGNTLREVGIDDFNFAFDERSYGIKEILHGKKMK